MDVKTTTSKNSILFFFFFHLNICECSGHLLSAPQLTSRKLAYPYAMKNFTINNEIEAYETISNCNLPYFDNLPGSCGI